MRNEMEWKNAVEESYQKPQMTKGQIEEMKRRIEEAKKENRKEMKNGAWMKFAVSAAAVAAAFVILPNTSANIAYAMEQIPVIGKLVEVVTLRDYEYKSDRYVADIEVPQVITDEVVIDAKEQIQVQEAVKKTAEEINAEIQQITDQIIAEFEESKMSQEGYQDVVVNPEVIATTKDYFTLKLSCYKGEASGYQWNYYYTIDLTSGERLQLASLFAEGADYITLISENIKEQMRTQMAENEEKIYWLDDELIGDANFNQITDETSFYVNEVGNVVISFHEGDVAPMYMGVVEFEIPKEILVEIRK